MSLPFVRTVIHSLRRKWPYGLLAGLVLSPVAAVIAWFAMVPSHSAVAFSTSKFETIL